jgi:hypothetical protein
MPNNIKHKMLVEAKRIANTEFKGKYIKLDDGTISYFCAKYFKEEEIERVVDQFEFNEDRFREMIRTFELRSKELVEIPDD